MSTNCNLYCRQCTYINYASFTFAFTFRRSHNLLADEIAAAIHSLASVNIGWFFGHFLPTFLATCEGVDNMQRATLLENFDKSTVCKVFDIPLNMKARM